MDHKEEPRDRSAQATPLLICRVGHQKLGVLSSVGGKERGVLDGAEMGQVGHVLTARGTVEALPFLVTGFSFRLSRSRSRRSWISQLGLRRISCLPISAPWLEGHRQGGFVGTRAVGPTLPPSDFGKERGRCC